MFPALWAKFSLHRIYVVRQAGKRWNRALLKQEQMEVCLLPPQESLGLWLISIFLFALWFGDHRQLLYAAIFRAYTRGPYSQEELLRFLYVPLLYDLHVLSSIRLDLPVSPHSPYLPFL